MKKETLDLVKNVASMNASMTELTMDKISEKAPDAEPSEIKLSTREIAKSEGCLYIEPKRKLPAIGALKPEWKSRHARDWEYVKGMFQSEVVNGHSSREPKKFWFAKWGGDPDCLWEVPVNTPVYLPRMIAHYLSGMKDEDTGLESMKFHTFDYVERPQQIQRPDEYTHEFQVTGTHYRGRFVPLGVF